MEKINLDWYQTQINLLDEVIENSRQQKQLVTSLYVAKMENEGWVYINTERWDYDASSGTSPRLISPELAAKMGISKEEKPSRREVLYYHWLRTTPELRGLYTKVLETEAWIKNNQILLNSLIEDVYSP
ncbi:hypothetical protein Pam2_93 [Pseudanabaena phage Pam2]|nr:hypothetical protein Pam2_93 [Pseudanabaena phage Pam2]